MRLEDRFEALPGGAMMAKGVADYEAGRRTVEAWLVASVTARLRRAGVLDPQQGAAEDWREPELALYALLQEQGGDAYARYNSLRREMDSFIAALGAGRGRRPMRAGASHPGGGQRRAKTQAGRGHRAPVIRV